MKSIKLKKLQGAKTEATMERAKYSLKTNNHSEGDKNYSGILPLLLIPISWGLILDQISGEENTAFSILPYNSLSSLHKSLILLSATYLAFQRRRSYGTFSI